MVAIQKRKRLRRSGGRRRNSLPLCLMLSGALLVVSVTACGILWLSFSSVSVQDRRQQQQSPRTDIPQNKPSLLVRQIPRIQADNVSFDEFQADYASLDVAMQPIVLENVFPEFDASQWTRQHIMDECGDTPLLRKGCYNAHDEDCHFVRFFNPKLMGKTWASLDVADLDKLGISTLRELLQLQDKPEGKHLYLHDATVRRMCPPAVERLNVPRYFTYNYDDLEWNYKRLGRIESSQHYPAIFISKKGTGSPIHIDGGMTRFWVQQLSGRKLWRLFPPSEYWRFGAKWRKNDYFKIDAMDPDFDKYPLLNGALVYETVLAPGQVIFVPENWSHQVLNLDDAISHGLNYVDWNFMPSYLKYWKDSMKDREYMADAQIQLWTAFFMPLDPRDNREENLDFHEYFESHHLAVIEKVPAAAKEFVEGRTAQQINSYRDIAGHPAIAVATKFQFVAVVKYLLETDEINVNEQDVYGNTALDWALDSGNEELSDLLAKHGGVDGLSLDKDKLRKAT
jgi:hypothetical protein